MSDIDSIKHVQEAEERGKSLVEHAAKSKIDKIAAAQEEANGLLEHAQQKARELKEKSIQETAAQLAKDRAKRLDEATSVASKTRKTAVTPEKLKQIVDQAVKEIMGA